MNKCIKCNEEYLPRQRNQRFCCSVCALAWHADERREALELLRGQTYFGRALVEAGSGRFASVGAVALGGPLPAPDWAHDPTGPESPIEGNGLTLGVALGGEGR